VDHEMIEKIRPFATEVIEVTASSTAIKQGIEGMVYSQMEAPAAAEMMGPTAHQEASIALSGALGRLL
jgi:hypothetical protein